MPYDTSNSSGARRRLFPSVSVLPLIFPKSKGFTDRDRLRLCSAVCVIWNGSLRVLLFLNEYMYVCVLIVWVEGPMPRRQEQYSDYRWCYDWTKMDLMFRILIGICGSTQSRSFTEPFTAITFSIFLICVICLLLRRSDQLTKPIYLFLYFLFFVLINCLVQCSVFRQ